MGILKLLTGGCFGVLYIIDIINIATGKLGPADGSPPDDGTAPAPSAPSAPSKSVSNTAEELKNLKNFLTKASLPKKSFRPRKLSF